MRGGRGHGWGGVGWVGGSGYSLRPVGSDRNVFFIARC